MKDHFGVKIDIGDRVTYITVSGHTPNLNKGSVMNIDADRKYKDSIQVKGDTNSRPGWTYPNRIICHKSVKINVLDV